MSIFLISKRKPLEEYKEQENNADVNVEDKQKQTDNETTKVTDIGIPMKDVDENTLMLDGPLSQVYTEALNKIYSKETIVTMLPNIINNINYKKDDNDEQVLEPGYVYVIDGDDIENDKYVETFESIRIALDKYKKIYLCIETHRDIKPKMASIMSFARKNGVTVIHDRNKAIEAIKQHLEG